MGLAFQTGKAVALAANFLGLIQVILQHKLYGMEQRLLSHRNVILTAYWHKKKQDEVICDVCLAYPSAPHKETLIQHEIMAQPWAKVCADLCDFRGQTLLVVCDYFSGFIEVERSIYPQQLLQQLASPFLPDMGSLTC